MFVDRRRRGARMDDLEETLFGAPTAELPVTRGAVDVPVLPAAPYVARPRGSAAYTDPFASSDDDTPAAGRRGGGGGGRRRDGAGGGGGVPAGFPPALDGGGGQAWVDEDDGAPGGGAGGVGAINVAAVAKRRKLRLNADEVALSPAAYTARLRTMAAVRAPSTAAWARTPAEVAAADRRRRRAHRRRARASSGAAAGDGGSDSGSSSSSDGQGDGNGGGGGGGGGSAHGADPSDLAAAALAQLQRSTEDGGDLGTAGRGASLPAGTVDIARLEDANVGSPSGAAVKALAFHPNGRLLMTAGPDRAVRLYALPGDAAAAGLLRSTAADAARSTAVRGTVTGVGGKRKVRAVAPTPGAGVTRRPDRKVLSVYIPDFPIRSAAFLGAASGGAGAGGTPGDTIVAAARSPFLITVDVATGTVSRLKPARGRVSSMPGTRSYAASQLPSLEHLLRLVATAADARVYVWDVRSHRCLGEHPDVATVHPTVVATTAGAYATGSSSGVVNLYGEEAGRWTGVGVGTLGGPPPALAKAFPNLTTPVGAAAFSPDGAILASSSYKVKNALRLAHVASRSVFANWPTVKTGLGRVHSIAWSPSGGYLAVGNEVGRALLFRLKAYPV
ncbi:hypothetical protein I4F81_007561 [Pyropia yezoensis]|uniref:Uncharacterized protein n=1 Tax=Pyropia yezoensis TaxID=2788 RepID=A0ACC3C4X2_PYRYE|nr:hypothetical protein I4F81_007561 [Neopyropia yezoensis]